MKIMCRYLLTFIIFFEKYSYLFKNVNRCKEQKSTLFAEKSEVKLTLKYWLKLIFICALKVAFRVSYQPKEKYEGIFKLNFSRLTKNL